MDDLHFKKKKQRIKKQRIKKQVPKKQRIKKQIIKKQRICFLKTAPLFFKNCSFVF